MEPFESDLLVRTKVTGRGLRFPQRYYGVTMRGPENGFTPDRSKPLDVSPTWTEIAAWSAFLMVALAIPIATAYLLVAKLL
jgi:hypothetical protein